MAQVLVKAKPWWKSATVWVNGVVITAAVLVEVQEALVELPAGLVPGWLTEALITALAVVNIVLRVAKTTLPTTTSGQPTAKAVDAPEPGAVTKA